MLPKPRLPRIRHFLQGVWHRHALCLDGEGSSTPAAGWFVCVWILHCGGVGWHGRRWLCGCYGNGFVVVDSGRALCRLGQVEGRWDNWQLGTWQAASCMASWSQLHGWRAGGGAAGSYTGHGGQSFTGWLTQSGIRLRP